MPQRGDPPALHKSKFPSPRSCSVRHTGGVDGGLTAQPQAYRVIDRLTHRASLLLEFPPQSNDYSIMLPLAHASSIPMLWRSRVARSFEKYADGMMDRQARCMTIVHLIKIGTS